MDKMTVADLDPPSFSRKGLIERPQVDHTARSKLVRRRNEGEKPIVRRLCAAGGIETKAADKCQANGFEMHC